MTTRSDKAKAIQHYFNGTDWSLGYRGRGLDLFFNHNDPAMDLMSATLNLCGIPNEVVRDWGQSDVLYIDEQYIDTVYQFTQGD